MTFVTKPDFSNNRQVKQIQLSNTQLSGTTTFGVDDVYIPMNLSADTINIDALQNIQTRGIILPNSIPEFTGTTYQLMGRDNDTGKVVEVTGISGGTSGGTANTDDYLTGTTFNTSTGDLEFTRLSGGTFTQNLDGRYLTGITDSTNAIIYVADISGDDGTAEDFNIFKPYKTLNAAIIAFKANALATRIQIIESSNTYTISEDLIVQTGTTDYVFTQSPNISGTITFSNMDFCNGAAQTVGTLEIDLPDFKVTMDDTTTLICTRSIEFLNVICDTLTYGAGGGGFLGLRAASGIFIANELISGSDGYIFDNVSDFEIDIDVMNFNASLGRLISFVDSVIIKFKTLNIFDVFRFINFLNPVGEVIINHGNIISTGTTATNLSSMYGTLWTIKYNDSIISGNHFFTVIDTAVKLTGNAVYEDSDYLFDKHNNVSNRTIEIADSNLTVDKLIDDNWQNTVVFKKLKLNLLTEIGTAITGTTHLDVMDITVINQSVAGELITGTTNNITLNAPLFINTGTTTSNSTITKYITEL